MKKYLIAITVLMLLASCDWIIDEPRPVKPIPKISVSYLLGTTTKTITGAFWFDAKTNFIKLWSDDKTEMIIISAPYVMHGYQGPVK